MSSGGCYLRIQLEKYSFLGTAKVEDGVNGCRPYVGDSTRPPNSAYPDYFSG